MRLISRRHFVGGLAACGAVGLLARARPSWGATPVPPAAPGSRSFELTVEERPVAYTGARRTAVAVNGGTPAPLLRLTQGDAVTLRVRNRLREPTSIHWHGLIVPADMDGVPGISFPGIGPGETFDYRFTVRQSGTYWYHSHSRFQEQLGLYGPMIVDRADGERHASDREHVLLLSDWTDLDPEHLYATLKRQSDYFNFGKRTVPRLFRDARQSGGRATLAERRMWNGMRMNPTDLADVGGAAYTYLLNGATPAGNFTALFKAGERVRLRFINGSSMSHFDVRIPGLRLTVIAADGQDVEPVTVDEFRIGAAETLDVIVQPEDRAYTVFAQSLDRAGYARGTLAPREGLEADVPALDPRPVLTMADMGMEHGVHAAGGNGHPAEHAGHGAAPSGTLRHAPSEYGPLIDMLASRVSSRLDDPGPGLRDSTRRVLTYADLHTIGGPIDRREPEREIELHLTGHMQRFVWSFDGRKFSDAEPLRFRHGERLRIVLVNDSMMSHPIHLHGMWSELLDEHGRFQVRKHTVNVHPAQRLAYAVSADALGRWAYHCHLLYHMEAGMFREVLVEHVAGGAHEDHAGHS